MKRQYQKLLTERLADFPCVALLGVRQCGKTTLLETLGEEWQRFDLERGSDFDLISRDPDLFLRLQPEHIAIDEAQLLPALFPALRVAIDANRNKSGRFVITGSSSPELVTAISESLAGRVAIIEMAPFSFSETQAYETSSFFAAFEKGFSNMASLIAQLKPRVTPAEVMTYWMRGGYPEPWLKNRSSFTKAWMDNYVQTYVNRDIARLFPGLNRERFRQFIQMLGGLSGTILNYSDIARTLAVSQPTVRDYLQIAHQSFIWRTLPAYAINPHKRLVKHPKGFLRDTGLLHHFLRIPDVKALLSHPSMGRSWEGMVIEEILRNLNRRGIVYEAYHYRTAAGGEVDLVLEGTFGLIPIEIKHTQTVRYQELQPLVHFIADHKCPFGLVINNDIRAQPYTETIYGIPFASI